MSTQTKYPAQATKRTAAAMVAAVPIAVAVLIGLAEVLGIISEQFSESFSENIQALIATTIGLFIGIATILTRILAIPAVNHLLEKVGLGAEPKKALKESQELLEGYTPHDNFQEGIQPTVEEESIENALNDEVG